MTDQVDFHAPFPKMKLGNKTEEIISAQVVSENNNSGGVIQLSMLSMQGQPGTNHIRGSISTFTKLFRYLTKSIPSLAVSAPGNFCHVVESAKGELYIILTHLGKKELEKGERAVSAFIFEQLKGLDLRMHDDVIHPTVIPPCVTFDYNLAKKVQDNCAKLWYYHPTALRGSGALREDLLENGWIKLDLYEKYM